MPKHMFVSIFEGRRIMSRKREVSKRKRVIAFLVIMFFVILLTNHRIMVNIGLKNAEKVNAQTIEYVKQKLDTYDNYQESMIAKGYTKVNGITLYSIFNGMLIEQDGVLVISKNNTILAMNKGIDQSLNNLENLYKNGKRVTDNLKKIRHNGKRWYVQKSAYKDYKIYILLSVNEVYHQYYIATLAIMVVYFLFCGVIGGIASYFERKNYKGLEMYYQIIDAVNSVFMGDLLINIDKGKAEWIKVPDRVKKRLGNYQSAEKIIQNIAEVYVQEEYREEYLQFTDIHTMSERLKTENILDYTYQDNYGAWINTLIVPQQTNRNGNVTSVLYLIRNVTEEMKKEKEYQKKLKVAGDAKTNFLRRMSHDIRTPINGIRGMIEIADHNPDDLKMQKEYRDKIKTATGFLLDLVNSILDMSKLESGEIKLEHKPFNLHKLLQRNNEITIMQCKDCGINYHVVMNHNEHIDLIGSPLHLQQVLMNLASNAVKYNKKDGDIFVGAREVSCTEDTVEYEFLCQDTGIGMSEEFQKHLFEPFTQENADARTKYAGTGLGMAITKELVDLLGGRIEVESKVGEGTKFLVYIPFKIDPCPKEEIAVEEQKEYSIEGMKILLVEDNDLNMEVAQYLLEEKGAVITKAWNGQEAIDLFSKSKAGEYDVILMDIMMPVMGGWEATRQIRKMQREDAATIPIIAMSANAFLDDIEHSKKVGMNGHVIKPLDMKVLIKTIGEAVDK